MPCLLPPCYSYPFVNQRSYHIGAHGLMEISGVMPESLQRTKYPVETRYPCREALRYFPYQA